MADDEFLGILFCVIYLKPGDQETSNLEMATNTEKKKHQRKLQSKAQ